MPVAPRVDEPLLDVKLLRLFDVLYTTRSVSRAAHRLHLSQPTASLWLGQLRATMRDPLFVRSPTGMAPTPWPRSSSGRSAGRSSRSGG